MPTFAGRVLIVALLLVMPSVAADPEDEVRQTLERYREAWLRNDKAGVLGVFTDDAVILPHHGVEPRIGKKAIEEFWFPAGSPPTPIHEFRLDVSAIRLKGDVAIAHGKTKLMWSMLREGREEKWRNQGTFLTVLTRKDGGWRITHQMWDDPPNERVP